MIRGHDPLQALREGDDPDESSSAPFPGKIISLGLVADACFRDMYSSTLSENYSCITVCAG